MAQAIEDGGPVSLEEFKARLGVTLPYPWQVGWDWIVLKVHSYLRHSMILQFFVFCYKSGWEDSTHPVKGNFFFFNIFIYCRVALLCLFLSPDGSSKVSSWLADI